MRSFDLFRTLAQARGKAGEDEIQNHFPILENTLQVQPDEIVVSEYEDYRKDKARAILDHIGLPHIKLVTTETGKSDGTIWETLPDVTEHIDDSAGVLGKLPAPIKGTLTRLHEYTKNENALLSHFPTLANTMREARLCTFHSDPAMRQLHLAQIEANFPMLYLASLLLHKRLTDETVLMSSRDCFLWNVLMLKFKQRTDAKYRVEYFFTSRLAREFPSPAYLRTVAGLVHHAVVVDLCGTGRSLSLLLDRVGKPNTPIYLVTQYSERFMNQAYGPTRLGNVIALTENGGANLERANLANHAMFDCASDFNPCHINWEMPEIAVQHDAFTVCAEVLWNYPLDLEATEEQIQAALQQTFRWIKEYDKVWEFASQFLKDEDAAVMAELQRRHGT